jgi:hypothetical protein
MNITSAFVIFTAIHLYVLFLDNTVINIKHVYAQYVLSFSFYDHHIYVFQVMSRDPRFPKILKKF